MYCSSCGTAVARGLSYCNYCGAKLNRGDSVIKSSDVKPEALVQSMAAVFVCGLGFITVFIGVMKAVLGLPLGPIVGFTLLCFLIMLLIEGVFIRLLLRRDQGSKGTTDTTLSRERATNELDAAQARVLPEPVPSVTEHTTRAFEPIKSERK